ncbi:hypothetical protein BYT27DRAFT_7186849 [Phlegmacium glaucopus]|nr:hypothetical protein BYT27DRAFT_7186849 [Phlegmacium glaucopus]
MPMVKGRFNSSYVKFDLHSINHHGSIDIPNHQKVGRKLKDSYLDEGFILYKSIAVNSLKRLENAKILIANTFQFFGHFHFFATDSFSCMVFGRCWEE